MPSRSPASKRAKPRPVSRCQSVARGRAKRRIAVGRLHLGAVVAARDQRQRRRSRAGRAGGPAPARSPAPARARGPSARNPAATGGRPCRRARAPASPSPRPPPQPPCAKAQKAGKLRSPKPSTASGAVGRVGRARQAGRESPWPRPAHRRRHRSRPGSMIRSARGVAVRGEGRHRRDMDALSGLRSARRAASRRSPRCCRPRCRRAGSSRPGLPAALPRMRGRPRRPASQISTPVAAHHRHAERHQPKHQPQHGGALTGVQHVDGLRDALPCRQVGPAKQRAGSLVEIARCPGRSSA